MDHIVRQDHPDVTSGALNNCHGDWYEYLIAMLAMNFSLVNQRNCLLLQLPNVSQFDVLSLYSEHLFSYINDLRTKVSSAADVKLISSNPDFVIIDTTDIDTTDFNMDPIQNITIDDISRVDRAHAFFEGKCSFESIIGYLAVKTSLRPDRRLQISHEGSLLKALYVHLQTREWKIDPVGLKYYAASILVGDADRSGLKTVATHSITNVQSTPIAAVDEVYELDSATDAIAMFEEILPS